MPSLGADMEAGTLVEWLVKPGDWVKRGDIVAVVETQKGAIEIETYQPGQIERILVDLQSKVPVGTPLALIRADGEAKPAAAPPPLTPPPPPAAAAPPPFAPPAPPSPRVITPVPPPVVPSVAARAASPAARKLAEERGIDLSIITGSGPGGAITYADVERRVSAPAAVAPPEKKKAPTLDLAAMRTAIAAAMARSKREIPHYYLEHQVDVTACEHWLAEKNAALPPDSRLLLGALTIKAVALAVRRFPAFNGFYRDNKFEPTQAVHVGVAISIRGGGLAAPALHDADHLSLDELMSRMRDLIQRTRAGRIRGSEMSDPTITVSSLGERGVEVLYGIIYPPQVAIVGIGKAVMRPWVIDGTIGPRSVVTVTLSGDHRVSDGHAGALFLAEIGKLLQEPDKL
ncbi:MAG TPA: dihydrolipoamide acetyltransferase family protein [Pseudolabrys sp.]|nr:dihydrolipoamide acetyltransferase family protein [Pseudolabrys sp.]